MVDRLVFLALRVRDLDASMRFYRDVLGVPLEPTDQAEGPFHFECSWREGAYLHFALFPADHEREPDRVWLGFSTPDIDAFHAAAVAAGTRVLQEPTDEPWGRSASYADPDGNEVGVTQLQ